jgi:hypothetical protein
MNDVLCEYVLIERQREALEPLAGVDLAKKKMSMETSSDLKLVWAEEWKSGIQ